MIRGASTSVHFKTLNPPKKYIPIYIYMCIMMYIIYIYIHMHILCTYNYKYIYIYKYTCVLCIIYIHNKICIYIFIYIYIYICIWLYMYSPRPRLPHSSTTVPPGSLDGCRTICDAGDGNLKIRSLGIEGCPRAGQEPSRRCHGGWRWIGIWMKHMRGTLW